MRLAAGLDPPFHLDSLRTHYCEILHRGLRDNAFLLSLSHCGWLMVVTRFYDSLLF